MADDTKLPVDGDSGKPDAIQQLTETTRLLAESLTNMKAEMNRKLDNLRPAAPPKEVVGKKSYRERFYEDEDAALAAVKEEAKQETLDIINESQRQRDQQALTANKLYQEFPELQEKAHPLTKKANEIYEAMSPEEQKQPMALKTAVAEAALELGVSPKSKRKEQESEDDGFSLGGSRGADSGAGKSGKRRKDDLPAETLEVAALMGLNTNDEKVVANLKGRAKRSNWNKYE